MLLVVSGERLFEDFFGGDFVIELIFVRGKKILLVWVVVSMENGRELRTVWYEESLFKFKVLRLLLEGDVMMAGLAVLQKVFRLFNPMLCYYELLSL